MFLYVKSGLDLLIVKVTRSFVFVDRWSWCGMTQPMARAVLQIRTRLLQTQLDGLNGSEPIEK